MRLAQLKVNQKELRMLTLLGHGLQIKAIAARLGISKQAVSFTLRRVLARHGLSNYFQLGLLAECCQTLPIDERNRIEDRREVRMDALRSAP